jgi:hypothetical protein
VEGGFELGLVLVGMSADEVDDLSVVVGGLFVVAAGLVDHSQSIVAIVDFGEAHEEIPCSLFGFVEFAVVDHIDDRVGRSGEFIGVIARKERLDPVRVLRRKVRTDRGAQGALSLAIRQALRAQYAGHMSWSTALHHENLCALAKQHPELAPVPSYSTIRRFLKAQGLHKRRRLSSRRTAGVERAEARLADREVRSYEAEYVGGLVHWDAHHGSLKIITPRAEWVRPVLFGVIDDRSRLVCHLAGAHMPGGFSGVMDDEHGEAVLPLQGAQVREQRGDFAAGVLIDAVQAYEGIQHQQARRQLWQADCSYEYGTTR